MFDYMERSVCQNCMEEFSQALYCFITWKDQFVRRVCTGKRHMAVRLLSVSYSSLDYLLFHAMSVSLYYHTT